jgi:hypothetical protein
MSKKKSPKQNKSREILWVDICEAKPNKMFTETERAAVRFLRFNRHVPCAACGKKVLVPWTMLCEFKATYDMDNSPIPFMLTDYPQTFPPLTPVCGTHCMHPAWPDAKKPNAKTA